MDAKLLPQQAVIRERGQDALPKESLSPSISLGYGRPVPLRIKGNAPPEIAKGEFTRFPGPPFGIL
jgi:hypothetical protein